MKWQDSVSSHHHWSGHPGSGCRECVMGNSSRLRKHGQYKGLALLLLIVLGAGCAGASGTAARADAEAPRPDTESARPADTTPWIVAPREEAERTLTGIDLLVESGFDLLAGKRVGLITNHTGRDRTGRSTIDLIHEAQGVQLSALFSPEHGIRGEAEAGERVDSGRDEKTGLPIHSLYGKNLAPTPEMLEGLDALVFDIQDIGTRYYTYIWTMALALQAAGEAGLEFVVLDRPNPLGGLLVQGNVLDSAYSSFVGLYPVPMRHGMTVGEVATMLNEEYGFGARLTVVPARGWRRSAWFDQTGLEWRAPSPNMPSLESALHYPGTCLFEGTNLSVGRGTGEAFQVIGAPWLDNAELVRRLRERGLEGVEFEMVTFTPERPGDGKFGGEEVRGVRLTATDRERYDPTIAAVAMLVEIGSLHPERLEWRVGHFDRLAGTDRIRKAILAGADLAEIVGGWGEELAEFSRVRARHLLYR